MSECRELEQNQPVRFVLNLLCGFLRFSVLRSVQ